MKKTVYDLLGQAAYIIRERGGNYGEIENSFQLIADIASLRLGRDIHPYEIAVILACVKNARNFATPDHEDSHIDAANYELFAATFAEDYARSATSEVSFKRKPERNVNVAPKSPAILRDAMLRDKTYLSLAEKLAAE
jgi:hypothetical protein